MSSTEYRRGRGGWTGPTTDPNGDYVVAVRDTGAQTAVIKQNAYRQLQLSIEDGLIANDGGDTETVIVTVVDALEVAQGTDPREAAVLDYDGTASVEIDGTEHSVSISDGTGTLDYATTQPAPTTVNVQATGLDSVPAESSNVKTIEVVQE
jgi:hypothetical protein